MSQRYTIDEASRVLGVSPDAPPAVVRRAFRRLALRHHPDRNPGDPGASDRFRAISDAYRCLTERPAPKPEPNPEWANPFAPRPMPMYPSANRRKQQVYYPTPSEIADLQRPVRFRPTKWLGWFCAFLILGAIVSAVLVDRSGGYVGPQTSWVTKFLERTSRRF